VPTLQYVKIYADSKDGAILHATDGEYGIRIRVDVNVSEPGCALLPTKEVIDSLTTIPKGCKITVENTDKGVRAVGDDTGVDCCFVSEEFADQFSDVADFTAETYHEIADADVLTAIHRTVSVVDKNEVRQALSGVCFESDGSTMYAVATDGRRLAIQEFKGKCVGEHSLGVSLNLSVGEVPEYQTIVPVNALKLLEKCLKEKATGKSPYSVKMAVKDDDERKRNIVTFQYGDITIFARLVEGRFPKWRSIVPNSALMHDITVRSGELKTALKSIAPSFSKTDPHVDLVFAEHRLVLNAIVEKSPYSVAPKEVRGTIEIPCNGCVTGKVGVNPKFLSDITSAFPDEVELHFFLPDGKEQNPILIVLPGDYSCVIMPISDSVDMPIIPAAQAERERKKIEVKSELEKRIAENTAEQNRRKIEDKRKRKTATPPNLLAKSELLRIDAKNVTATGYEIEGGFMVCKGSQAVVEEAPSLKKYFKKVARARESFIEQGILKENAEKGVYVFTQNCLLDSPTHAANVVLGVSSHGDECWKDEHGTPLKEIWKRKSET
jgi:DNA polymerase-3 subunit beta